MQHAVVGRGRQRSVAFLAILLAVLSASTLAGCYYAIVVPQQLDEGEPVVYGLATRVLHHQALYQPTDSAPFIQVYYPPVYIYAVAQTRSHFGPGFGPGRALSLVAGLVATALLARITASNARNRWAGGFVALMFLGLGFLMAPAPFLALERVDVLGVAWSIAAIAVLSHGTNRAHVLLAAALAGLALLTKQSLFAAALAGTIWLATISIRRASLFAVATAITVLVPSLLLQWTSSGAFWNNVGPANLTPTSLTSGWTLFKELLVIQGVPTLLAAYFVVRCRAWTSPPLRLLVIYWLMSAISVVGITKVGANHNYWIEFAAANSVLATLAIWTGLRPYRRIMSAIASMLPIWLLAAQLGVLVPARFLDRRSFDVVPLSWTLLVDPLTRLTNEAPGFNELVHDVRGEKGIVLGESMDIAVLADQPLQIEPFAYSMLEEQGRWNSDPLVDKICSGQVTLLLLSYPIESEIYPVGLVDFPMWPRSVMAALRQAMQIEQFRAFHWLYRSRPSPDAATITICKAVAAAERRASRAPP